MKDGGYLMIDHRASPGLPEDIARKTGLDPHYTGEGKLFEAATLTCSHCKCSVIKNPARARERATCPKCNFHYICDLCAIKMRQPDYQHEPFSRIVDSLFTDKPQPQMGSPPKLLMPD